ncbi:hypothetical protein CLNEO_25140 [Anaerotignum neopropionicum]|uniref:Sensor histidine kinase NatK-like C-terminal domain-containing protein n=1 Tax=Anaerotignum neopropionicum TaxID=36847 RepID=A0A136WCB6_9FIRM|nr:ATP-binding protein [Anaerotignum neopropionicum]KXL52165.1 hypothetical protein CLNEO_25140 [Anaerotignum neopropionicum]
MPFTLILSLLVIINALVIMTILLDVRPTQLSAKRRICFFVGLFAILLIQIFALFLIGPKTYAKLYLFFAQLPALILFWAVSKQGFIKPVFVVLTTIFLSSLGTTISKILNHILYLPPAMKLITILTIDVILLFFIWRYMKPSFDYLLNVFGTRDILGFCAVPLLYNFMILATGGYGISEQNMTFKTLICLSTLAAFFLLMNVFRRAKEMEELQSEKNMMTVQLFTAKQKMEELYHTAEQAAIYRHDIRHHLSLIGNLAENGELDKIKAYLFHTEQEIKAITPVHFCENETVNMIVSYFSEKAKKENITLSVKAVLPKNLNFSDTELCSVLSNGLENALCAVSEITDTSLRKIFLNCSMERNLLLIEIENAYIGELRMQNGIPFSKEEGHGYGCRSVLSIAQKRKGFCTFKADDGIFTLRVVLSTKKE